MTAMDTKLRDHLISKRICIACTHKPVPRAALLYCPNCAGRFAQIESKQASKTNVDLYALRRSGRMPTAA